MSEHTRYLALQLLRICKRFETKSLAQNTALAAIAKLDQEVRAVLSVSRISEMVLEAAPAAKQIIDQEYAQLERALEHGTDFQFALRCFLDKHQ
jgi:hypothetical protein